MKIVHASITDPLLKEETRNPPELHIRVDVDFDEIHDDFEIVKDTRDYKIYKFGHVYYVESGDGSRILPPYEINTQKDLLGKPLMPRPLVAVLIHDSMQEVWEEYAIKLDTARRLVRDHATDYRMSIDKSAAEYGEVRWIPVEKEPQCMATSAATGRRCMADATLPYMGREFGLCSAHSAERNRKYATMRVGKDNRP